MRYAPLCIHSFRLIVPRKLLEAQLFNRQYQSYEEIESISDRLRWCRYHMGLMQKEVAQMVGISRNNYIELETGAVDHFEKAVVDKLAALFQIPPEDLLDGYNRFLYKGQGSLIREYRLGLGLGKRALARQLRVDPNLLRRWETEKIRISKASWEKYFKDRIT